MADLRKKPDLNDVGKGPSKDYTLEDLLGEFSATKQQNMEPLAPSANPGPRQPAPDVLPAPRAELKPAQTIDMEEENFLSRLPALPSSAPMEAMKVGNQFQAKLESAPNAQLPILPPSKDQAKVEKADQIRQENPDKFQQMFSKQQDELLAQLKSAQDKLKEGEELTEKEKLARGLLAILPTLFGAGLGAAISGGVGGNPLVGLAQGAAGGAQGGSSAIGMLEGEKAQKRKEARSDIENIRDRSQLLQNQILGRESVLEERGLRKQEKEAELGAKKEIAGQEIEAKKSLAQAEQEFKKQEASEKRKFEEAKYKADNATTLEGKKMWTDVMAQQFAQMKELKGQQLDIMREKIANDVKRQNAKASEQNQTFLTNVGVSKNLLGQLETAVKNSGTWESRFGNTADSATLEAVPYQLAINYAKIVDPKTAAREGEVAAAQKYLIQLGPTASKEKVLQQIKHYSDTIQMYEDLAKKGMNPDEIAAKLSDKSYSPQQDAAIDNFAKANKLSREKAIEVLKQNNRL